MNNLTNIRRQLNYIRKQAQRVYQRYIDNKEHPMYCEMKRRLFVEDELRELGFANGDFEILNRLLSCGHILNDSLASLVTRARNASAEFDLLTVFKYLSNDGRAEDIAPIGYVEKEITIGFNTADKLNGSVFIDEVLFGNIAYVNKIYRIFCHRTGDTLAKVNRSNTLKGAKMGIRQSLIAQYEKEREK